MRPDDLVRIRHMLEAATDAISFAEGRRREDLNTGRMLTLSIVKSIEILGEAASKITPETRVNHPEIPWSVIVAMRNRLIHGYYEIDLDRVWDTVTEDLPPLKKCLEEILKGAE
jgi:uncharacterized protein with HEPN domain